MPTAWSPADVAARIESAEALDRIADPLGDLVRKLPPSARSVLQGDWLGHPLHPVLTDLPIGFWTSSWVLDLTVPRRAARTSTALAGIGVLSAIPTMAAGLVDWAELSREQRRVGLVHLAAAGLATATYASSFAARVGGHRRRGIALGMVGAGLATAAGYLGGHLVFGSAEDEAPAEDAEQVRAVTKHLHGESGNGVHTEPVLGA
jgi:uncharacterized membrane protein